MPALYLLRSTWNDDKYYCFTKKEVDKLKQDLKFEDQDFSLIESKSDLQKCLKSEMNLLNSEDEIFLQSAAGLRSMDNEYKHPSCRDNFNIVSKFITDKITNTDVVFLPEGHNFTETVDNGILNKICQLPENLNAFKNKVYQCMSNNNNSCYVVLKVGQLYTGGDSHYYSMYVTIENAKITNIDIVDTGPPRIINTSYIFSVLSDIILGLPIRANTRANYLFSEEGLSTSLQKCEAELNILGYCGAWSLYFLQQHILENKSFSTIYQELKSLDVEELTSLIIHWWDEIYIEA